MLSKIVWKIYCPKFWPAIDNLKQAVEDGGLLLPPEPRLLRHWDSRSANQSCKSGRAHWLTKISGLKAMNYPANSGGLQ